MLLYDQMVKQGLVLCSEVSYHYRFFKAENLARPLVEASSPKDPRRFAYDEVNRIISDLSRVIP